MIYIYGIDNCEFCEKAKALACEKGIEFKYVDMPTILERKIIGNKYGMRTAPIITEDEILIGGYTEFKNLI